MFIAEFNNYEEIIDVLSEDEYVKQSIEGLGEIDKQKALIEFGIERIAVDRETVYFDTDDLKDRAFYLW